MQVDDEGLAMFVDLTAEFYRLEFERNVRSHFWIYKGARLWLWKRGLTPADLVFMG
ncbi:MAG: hypothetical protein HC942_26615 [Microcoleus sp. SU_5_6]|nr:hypothetical protein [Microcoleus sp. SU_5_6]